MAWNYYIGDEVSLRMSSLNIEPFDGTDFADYLDRVKFYFVAKSIGVVASGASDADKQLADAQKSATFITLIGKDTYKTLKDLCYPDDPVSKSFKEICDLLEKHFAPSVNVASETYRFQQCQQLQTESVGEFANRLKRLAASCDFGGHLQRALRDQFVRGLRSRALTKKLLTDNADFQTSLGTAVAEELAERNAEELTTSPPLVHAVQHRHISAHSGGTGSRDSSTSNGQSARARRCGGCGGLWHARRELCPAWGKTCHKCQKANHFAKHCRLAKHTVNAVTDVDPEQSTPPQPVLDAEEYSLIARVSGTPSSTWL